MPWSQASPHSQYSVTEWYLNMSSTQCWMHDCRSALTKAKHNSSLSQGMWNLLSNMGIWKRLCERSPHGRQNKKINKTTWNLGFSKFELIKTPLNCAKNNYFKSGSYNFIYHSMRWETVRQTGVLRKLVFLDSLFNSTLRTSPVTKLRFRFNFRLGPSSETGCMALFTFLNFNSSYLWSGTNNPYLLRLQWGAEGWILIKPPNPHTECVAGNALRYCHLPVFIQDYPYCKDSFCSTFFFHILNYFIAYYFFKYPRFWLTLFTI